MNKSSLTDKQRLWAEYYIQTGNATLSARLAGYKGKYHTLGVVGHDNLKKPKIKAFLDERYREAAMGADEVLARLAKKARASITDFVDEYGIIDWKKVQQSGDVIKSITHTKGKQSKIELESPMKALELIGKHFILFTDKVQLEIGEELLRQMQDLGLSNDDIRSDPLLSGLFTQAGVEIAGIAADGTSGGEEAS